MVALCICLLASPSGSQELRGKVTEIDTGKPIANAKVVLSSPNKWDRLVYGVSTNSTGTFDASRILEEGGFEPGDVVIVGVTARGHHPIEEEIVIAEGASDQVFRLTKIVTAQQRDFRIRYRDPTDMVNLVRPYCDNDVTVSRKLGTITVKETAETLEAIEQVIAKYDVPPKQIWLEVVLVMASGSGEGEPTYPEEIEEVVRKLGPLFRFSEYEIIGRANAMGLEGSSMHFSSGDSGDDVAVFEVGTQLGYADEVITLEQLSVAVQKPTGNAISTSVNLRDGEKVILGASRGDARKGSLITVLTAKVVQ
jgi:hypothetical protein